MMQGYRNLPGRYDVIADKEERRALWDGLFTTASRRKRWTKRGRCWCGSSFGDAGRLCCR